MVTIWVQVEEIVKYKGKGKMITNSILKLGDSLPLSTTNRI
jgi:hypothetical protein